MILSDPISKYQVLHLCWTCKKHPWGKLKAASGIKLKPDHYDTFPGHAKVYAKPKKPPNYEKLKSNLLALSLGTLLRKISKKRSRLLPGSPTMTIDYDGSEISSVWTIS